MLRGAAGAGGSFSVSAAVSASNGSGRALRSSLPEGVIGSASTVMKNDGSIVSGRRLRRKRRKSLTVRSEPSSTIT